MKNILLVTIGGIKTSFENKKYYIVFAVSFIVMFILFTLIPVFTVAGNTVATQLDIFTLRDYVVIAILAGIYSVFISMQIYVMRQRKKVAGVGTTVGGGLGALFAGIAGTAFCASCLAPLFAIFGIGLGGVVFVLQYRFYFVTGAIILMMIAIYLTSRKIQKICDACSV
jgi:hypothetical protein